MTLRELVKYKQSLLKIKSKLSLEHAIDYKNNYVRYLESNFSNPDYDRSIRSVKGLYKEMSAINQRLIDEVDSLITKLDVDIDLASKHLLFADWAIDQVNAGQGINPDNIDNNVLERIQTRIKGYCDWHYPALQIASRFKHWVDLMVTADPLYISNSYGEFIDQIVASYPDEYQRRLRAYTCPYNDLTKVLPNNQFSFVLCWDTLNYAPQNEIEKLLILVKQLLRPGGTFMFSYNNCETETGAHLAEINNMSYINKRKLLEVCEQLGYTVIADENCKNSDSLYQNISWLEIKLPGTLTTSKAHQVLGKIMDK